MRYLVTGGAGFIGSHIVEHLVTAGHEVVVLDNFLSGRRENLEPWRHRIELVEGSITDQQICGRAMRGVDYVLHQAALPSVPRSVRDPLATHESNATGTLNLLLAAKTAGVRRVVYAASSSAYGNTEELPKREEMAAKPLSPYAASKLAGEIYASVFHTTYGLETIALRYFNVFGPRQDPNSQYAAAIPRFIIAALADQSPTIYGDGNQTRDFTYVANVVQANMLACEAPAEAYGRVLNVGCGERITVNDLWTRICALTGSEAKARYEPSRAGDVRDSLASLENARKYLGYTPSVGLEEGLRRTVAFFAPERVVA
jgi:nucleoside-diphosphate-sugar epimerase